MTDDDLLAALAEVRAVPVLRSATADDAIATARSLAAGGLTIVELTFSTPSVTSAIAELAGSGLVIGAGTITTEDQARAAARAGARFLVSPVHLPWLVDLARELGVAAMPAAATPTEIWQAHSAGALVVKVFPIARLGGAAYIRDILAPLPQLRLMATGGVTIAGGRDLLAAGCLAVGLGSVHGDARLGASVEQRARTALACLSAPGPR